MVKSIFELLFLTEVFLLVLSKPYKYVLVNQGKSWSEAQAYCKANFVDLAIPTVNDYLVELKNEAQKRQFTSGAWIGLFDDVQGWRWSFGNQPLGGVTDWCSGEPNNLMEDCVISDQTCWRDVGCGESYPFVCFKDSDSGSSRFIHISTSMTFKDAQTYCRLHHTDLASLTTLQEISTVQQIITQHSWIGLFRDAWLWTDKSKLSGSPWGLNPWIMPLNYACGKFVNGRVNPAPCSDIMPFFCLRDFTQKITLRIKVKSTQDVNDSAVKAEILQKIKEKMEEHGMSHNTKVKWRETSDGTAFRKIEENNAINVTGVKVTCNSDHFWI